MPESKISDEPKSSLEIYFEGEVKRITGKVDYEIVKILLDKSRTGTSGPDTKELFELGYNAGKKAK